MKTLLKIAILFTFSLASASAATLTVNSTVTANAGFWHYMYSFTTSTSGGGTGIDNIYLGSRDLSPLNVEISKNGGTANAWSWLGNDIPVNYLQFFTASDPLAAGDVLAVSFISLYPAHPSFAMALDSSSGESVSVDADAPGAVPEPSAMVLLASGLALVVLLRKRSSNA